jgi:dipeptidyl aminopeptidase/acylaminoacyl peptidase
LKMKGVPVKLLQFNDEYHGTGSKPSNYIRTQLYMLSWFNSYTRQSGRVTSTTSQP